MIMSVTRPIALDGLGTSIRAALAAGLAVASAQLLQLQFPLYAMIAAVIVTDVPASRTRQLSLRRLAGPILGATRGAAINPLLKPGAWGIGLSILAAMFLSHLLRLHNAAKVAGYVCGIVVLNHGSHPWSYALYRVTDTALGIGLALPVSLVPKLVPMDGPQQSIHRP